MMKCLQLDLKSYKSKKLLAVIPSGLSMYISCKVCNSSKGRLGYPLRKSPRIETAFLARDTDGLRAHSELIKQPKCMVRSPDRLKPSIRSRPDLSPPSRTLLSMFSKDRPKTCKTQIIANRPKDRLRLRIRYCCGVLFSGVI